MVKENINHIHLSSEQLLSMDIKTERQEEVSVNNIVVESALIDPIHAQNLCNSMKGDRGQISPTTLRARQVENGIVFDVIDGFHRSAAKRIIQKETNKPQNMKATVLYGCNDEELFDLRVLAASSVKSIKFARMAEWMKKSFQNTKWENQRLTRLIESEDVVLSQVFALAQNNSSGRNLKLSTTEAIELKTWAKRKSAQWRRPLSTLIIEMRTVELAAPDLVQKVRTGGGGGRGILTRARLQSIVKNLPGEWEIQRLFAEMAVEKNILAPELDMLAWGYVFAKQAADEETMNKILKTPESILNPPVPKPIADKKEEPINPSKPFFVPVRKFRSTPHRRKHIGISKSQTRETKKHIEEFDERTILRKHNIPQLYKALVESVLQDKGEKLVIITLPTGDLTLDTKDSNLSLDGKNIQLSASERDLMLALSIFEGVPITEEVLSILNLSKKFSNINVRIVIPMLQTKIANLSYEATKELRYDKGKYSWLAK